VIVCKPRCQCRRRLQPGRQPFRHRLPLGDFGTFALGVLAGAPVLLASSCVQMAGPCTTLCMSKAREAREQNQARHEQEEALKEHRRKALTAPLKPAPLAKQACGDEALIDDGEDGDGLLNRAQGRNGSWHTTRDMPGVMVEPATDATYRTADVGTKGSAKSARLKCTDISAYEVQCGLALDFKSPIQVYDASMYGGISFVVRTRGNSAAKVFFHVRDADTDRESDLCLTCGQHLGTPITLSDNWTQYTIAYGELKPTAAQAAGSFRQLLTKGLYGLSWDVQLPKGEFELWVDDVRFTGCPEPAKPVSPFLLPSPVSDVNAVPAPLQPEPSDPSKPQTMAPTSSATGPSVH
jgi:hypothetical protein